MGPFQGIEGGISGLKYLCQRFLCSCGVSFSFLDFLYPRNAGHELRNQYLDAWFIEAFCLLQARYTRIRLWSGIHGDFYKWLKNTRLRTKGTTLFQCFLEFLLKNIFWTPGGGGDYFPSTLKSAKACWTHMIRVDQKLHKIVFRF